MATISTGQWPSVVQKGLSLVFLDQFRAKKSMLPLIYRFKDAEQGTEYDLEGGDVGTVPELTDGITFEEVREGYKKSVSETEYGYGLKVTRRLLRNDLYGAVEDSVANLASAFRDLRETKGASPFNHAFDGSFLVGDGLALASASHTSKYGGSTQSNLSTLAFSAANLFTVQNLMKKIRTNRDNIMDNIPDTIIAPMEHAEKAYEICASAGKVDYSTNNRNYFEGKYKVIIWDNYLTDTNNWFLVNSERMLNQLLFREWEPVQFFKSGEFDNLTSKFAGYCSFAISTAHWRWAYCMNVT